MATQGLKTVAQTLAISWGRLRVYNVPPRGHIKGREFQIIPSGSMFNADEALHGLIGRASPNAKNLILIGSRGTKTTDLDRYQQELARLFSERPDAAADELPQL